MCSVNFEIVITSDFLKSLKSLAKRHRSLKDDFKLFSDSIKKNPFQGTELSPGIRKIRMQITSKGRGKSGGARVITYTTIVSEIEGKVYFLEIYDKTDFDTVDVSIIIKKIKQLDLK